MKVRLEFDIDAAEAPRVTPLIHAFNDFVQSLNAVDLSSRDASRFRPRTPEKRDASPDSTAAARPRPRKTSPSGRTRAKKRHPPLDTCERVFAAVAQGRVPVKRAAVLLQQMLLRADTPVLEDDIISAATAELVDPAKVCNHPSRASNIVLTVAAVEDTLLHKFRTRFVADTVEQLSKPRQILCDRALFLGYSEGLAAMVNAQIISADTAIELIQNLLRTEQSCTAAISTLCRIADTCEQPLDALVEHRHMLQGVKNLLANVATIPEYAYDIQFLNGVTGWDISLSPTARPKQL